MNKTFIPFGVCVCVVIVRESLLWLVIGELRPVVVKLPMTSGERRRRVEGEWERFLVVRGERKGEREMVKCE